MKRFTFFVVGVFLSSVSFAEASNNRLIDHYFNLLKDLPVKYHSHGAVCEYMARHQFQQQYSADQYDVVVGIAYRDESRIIGELDLVVFRKVDGEAIAYGEVKCRRHARHAHTHAVRQLARFHDSIESHRRIRMYLVNDHSTEYFPDEFDEEPEQWTISHKGTGQYGFTYELELNMNDVLKLHRRLLDCQKNGRCSR